MVRGRVAGDSVADVGPASVMVGNIVQGNRLASAQGRDMGVLDEDSDNAKKVCVHGIPAGEKGMIRTVTFTVVDILNSSKVSRNSSIAFSFKWDPTFLTST